MKKYLVLFFGLYIFSMHSMEKPSVHAGICKLACMCDGGEELEIDKSLNNACKTLKHLMSDLVDEEGVQEDIESLPVPLPKKSVQLLKNFHISMENNEKDEELQEALLSSFPFYKLISLFQACNFLDYAKQDEVLSHLMKRIKDPKNIKRFFNRSLDLNALGGQTPLIVEEFRKYLVPLLQKNFLRYRFSGGAACISIGERAICSVALSKEKKIVAGTSNGDLVIIDGKTSEVLHRISAYSEEVIDKLYISPDGNFIISGCSTVPTKIWKFDGKNIVLHRTLDRSWGQAMGVSIKWDVDHRIYDLSIAADGKSLFLVGPGLAESYDIESGHILNKFIPEGKSEVRYMALALMGDDQKVVIGSADGFVRMWSADGKLIWEANNDSDFVSRIMLSRKGIVVTDQFKSSWLLDYETGKTLQHFQENGRNGMIVGNGAISNDGAYVITQGFSSIGLWNIETGTLINSAILKNKRRRENEDIITSENGFCIIKQSGVKDCIYILDINKFRKNIDDKKFVCGIAEATFDGKSETIMSMSTRDGYLCIGNPNGKLWIIDLNFPHLDLDTALLSYYATIDSDAVVDLLSSSQDAREGYGALDDSLKKILFQRHASLDDVVAEFSCSDLDSGVSEDSSSYKESDILDGSSFLELCENPDEAECIGKKVDIQEDDLFSESLALMPDSSMDNPISIGDYEPYMSEENSRKTSGDIVLASSSCLKDCTLY